MDDKCFDFRKPIQFPESRLIPGKSYNFLQTSIEHYVQYGHDVEKPIEFPRN